MEPILIIGGTRGTGRLAAERLVASGQRVRVLARDPARAAARLTPEVEIVSGDITKAVTLPAAVLGAGGIIFTAGVRSARPALERRVRRTEYEGVLNTLAAARTAGFAGRLVYMTSMGIITPSLSGALLNLIKGNTLVWRRRAEEAIRSSGLDYAIVRAAFLLNSAGGQLAVEVTQSDLPLAPAHRIARADVASVLVVALRHPRASRTTFEVAWGRGGGPPDWGQLLNGLRPDVRRERR